MRFEVEIIRFLQTGISDFWTVFFKAVSFFGGWLGFFLLLFALFLFRKRLAFVFFGTYCFTTCFQYCLKVIFDKNRPYVDYEGILSLSQSLGNSMPSGHATSSIVIGTFLVFWALQMAKKKSTIVCTTILTTFFVGLVGLSRMYLGVHYLTDVLFGYLIGLVFSIISILFFSKFIKKDTKIMLKESLKNIKLKIISLKKLGGKMQEKFEKEYVSNSEKETILIAEKIAKHVQEPSIVVLKGDLGAGKTHFVKGFAKGKKSKNQVTSPTFTIHNTYKTKKGVINHFDMYRLNNSQEGFDCGFEEYFDLKTLKGVTIIEWAEKIPELITGEYVKIEIQKIDENQRKILVKMEGK